MRAVISLLTMLALVATAAGASAQESNETLDLQRLAETYRALTALPHRLAGTTEGRIAGDIILKRLRDAGFTEADVFVQEFTITQAVPAGDGVYLERDGKRFPLSPLRPNGLALPVTPREGLAGETVYLGDGDWSHFDEKTVTGQIAVMELGCGDRWLRAFADGALAVVFVDSSDSAIAGREWLQSTTPLPRFYMTRDAADQAGILHGASVRIVSQMRFEQRTARNIFGLVGGHGARSASDLISLACDYDTLGVAPLECRSPRQAANVAGILEAAAYWKRNAPAHPVLLAFFDANAQDGYGQLAMQFARMSFKGGTSAADSLAGWINQRESEERALRDRLSSLEDPLHLLNSAVASRSAVDEQEGLRNYIIKRYESLTQRRMALVLERVRLERAVTDSAADEAMKAARERRIVELDLQVESISRERAAVESLRRAIVSGMLGREEQPALADAAAGRRTELMGRLDEVAQELRDFRSHFGLGQFLEGRTIRLMAFSDLAPTAARWCALIPSAASQTKMEWGEAKPGWRQGNVPEFVPRAALSTWIADLPDGAWPTFAASPRFVGITQTWRWRVSAQAHYVIELSSPGTSWPKRWSPEEAAADLDAVGGSFGDVVGFLERLAVHPEVARIALPAAVTEYYFRVPNYIGRGRMYDGNTVHQYAGASGQANEAAAGVVVLIRPHLRFTEPIDDGATWGHYVTTSAYGTFPVLADFNERAMVLAARFDDRGRIDAMTQFQPGGRNGGAGKWDAPGWFQLRRDNVLQLYDATSVSIWHALRPFHEGWEPGLLRLLQATTDTPFAKMNLSLDSDVATAWFAPSEPLKSINGALLLLGSTADDPEGRGYAPSSGLLDARRFGAADTWTLNESRLASLRRFGILQDELERLHTRAEELRDEAVGDSSRGLANARLAGSLGYSQRAYVPVRGVINDLIKAVVILLLLAIPFSAIVERLVVATPNVYHQIGWFTAIFLAVFGVLYAVHPAFRFATFPVVVLLAFVIIIMSGFVIYVMWSKFEHEVKAMQGVATASHRSTRNNRNTAAAAVSLGIATMRRRPLRTALTASTVVLLTFTLLFFSSLDSEGGVRHIYVGGSHAERQVEATLPGAKVFSEDSVEVLQRLWSTDTRAYVRRWIVGNGRSTFAGRGPDDRVFALTAIGTLPPDDLRLYPAAAASITGDLTAYARDGGILLPARLAESLRLEIGDTIELADRRWLFRGTFDPEKLRQVRTIVGVGFIPLDVEAMKRVLAQQNPGDSDAQTRLLEQLETASFRPVDAEAVGLVWSPAEPTEIPARSLVLLPPDDRSAVTLADELVTMLNGRVAVSAFGQIERVIYTDGLSFAGFGRLVVPLILGGLIVFGTMLSSVSDREREIFTFSAIGLAPSHVAALFFAEATVFAILGGMGGYLFSQLFAKGVGVLVAQGLCPPVNFNHSSLNAMVVMLVVMATVMVSTIYPAIRASRAANPGVQRRWKMPPAAGDSHLMKFPFTVSLYDLVGLLSFLGEYFEAHRDRTVGNFAAANVQLDRTGLLGLRAKIWLQPFDQGVSQHFTLRAAPGGWPGVLEVHIELHRVSGPPSIWLRGNRAFIHELREQFIFWRTIGDTLQDEYHQTTLNRLGVATMDDLVPRPAEPSTQPEPLIMAIGT